MRNIFKSQFYQIKRDRFFICAIIFISALSAAFTYSGMTSVTEKINGGMALKCTAEMLGIISVVAVLVITGRICGWDLQDKTFNYESFSGHKRAESLMARFLLSLCISAVFYTLMWGIPVLYGVLVGGWGPNMDMQDAFLRIFVCYFLIFRVAAEVTLLTLFTKNSILSVVLSYFAMGIPGVFLAILETESPYMIWISSLLCGTWIFDYSNMREGFFNGESIVLYTSRLPKEHAAVIVATSVLVGALCLLIGLRYLKKQDLR